ncbi:MAG TPA: AI-2E family transporter [Streptosporangiaceae bacterium]|nr:AI-2E family transporter [Streptosporangiaceae bacterium]
MSGPGTEAGGTRQDERPEGAFTPWSRAFLRHAALWLTLAIAGGLVAAGIADSLLHRLGTFIQIIIVSLFLSFAIEPAVSYLAKRGWRRGLATGLVFVGVLVLIAGLIALLVPAVVTGTRQALGALPDLVHNLSRYLRPLGVHLDKVHVEDQLRTYGSKLLSGAGSLLGGVVHVATSLVGGLFQAVTIALFTFYMVARGPQMRRAVLSRFDQERQRQILFIWERAIEQTGGYFYSRLLLALVNGLLMYAVLRWRGVPFAAPLALFEGFTAEFIPIVGTYIAGAVPALVALLYDPVDALIVVIWILLYQQIENYLLSPRLTAKTMDLSAPVALAAALIGGTLGGILFAFLALPVAGVIQASFRAYGRYYQVVEESGGGGPGTADTGSGSPRHSGRRSWFPGRRSGTPPPSRGDEPPEPPERE